MRGLLLLVFAGLWSLPLLWVSVDRWLPGAWRALSDVAWSPAFLMAALRAAGVAVASALLTVALALPCAVVLARSRARLRSRLLVVLLWGLRASPPLLVAAMLLRVEASVALGPRWSVALAHVGMQLPVVTWILTLAVARRTRAAVEDAADLDGLGIVSRVRLVWLPQLRGDLALVGVLAAAMSWTEGVVAVQLDRSAALLPAWIAADASRAWPGALLAWLPLLPAAVVVALWHARRERRRS